MSTSVNYVCPISKITTVKIHNVSIVEEEVMSARLNNPDRTFHNFRASKSDPFELQKHVNPHTCFEALQMVG